MGCFLMKTPHILYFKTKTPNCTQIFCFSVTFFSAKILFLRSSLAWGGVIFADSLRVDAWYGARSSLFGGRALRLFPTCRARPMPQEIVPHSCRYRGKADPTQPRGCCSIGEKGFSTTERNTPSINRGLPDF